MPTAVAPRHIRAAAARIAPALGGRAALLEFYERYARRGARQVILEVDASFLKVEAVI